MHLNACSMFQTSSTSPQHIACPKPRHLAPLRFATTHNFFPPLRPNSPTPRTRHITEKRCVKNFMSHVNKNEDKACKLKAVVNGWVPPTTVCQLAQFINHNITHQ